LRDFYNCSKHLKAWTHEIQNAVLPLLMCPDSEYSTCVFTKADLSKTKSLEDTVYAYPRLNATVTLPSLISWRDIRASPASAQSFSILPYLHWLFLKMHLHPVHGTKHESMTHDVRRVGTRHAPVYRFFFSKSSTEISMT